MKREGEQFRRSYNNGHRNRLRGLLRKESRRTPEWLEREAGSKWERTITIEGSRRRQGRSREQDYRKGGEWSMWDSWRERREERDEGVELGEEDKNIIRQIEKKIGEKINVLEGTPKKGRGD